MVRVDCGRKAMACFQNAVLSRAVRSWQVWLELHLVKRAKLQSATLMMADVYAGTSFRSWSAWLRDKRRAVGNYIRNPPFLVILGSI